MRTLVLVHGWAMTPTVFGPLRARLSSYFDPIALPLAGYCGVAPLMPYNVTSLARELASRAPARCVVAGWSLGGQVALEWARIAPTQVSALALIGSTPSFVQREDWGRAVGADVFDAFVASIESQRDATLARFASLQSQGDVQMKRCARELRASLASPDDASTDVLRQGLAVLLHTDQRDVLREVSQETRVIHGADDRLVPVGAAEHLARELERSTLHVVSGAAHAPFVTQPDAVVAALAELA